MTVSILDVLATLPSGIQGQTLTWDELGQYLQKFCNTDTDKKRGADHALRDELYRDGGVQFMEGMIDKWFTDTKVRELRKAWVPFARFNNTIRRVVHELATVYSEHARRMVDSKTDAAYQSIHEAQLLNELRGTKVRIGFLINFGREKVEYKRMVF